MQTPALPLLSLPKANPGPFWLIKKERKKKRWVMCKHTHMHTHITFYHTHRCKYLHYMLTIWQLCLHDSVCILYLVRLCQAVSACSQTCSDICSYDQGMMHFPAVCWLTADSGCIRTWHLLCLKPFGPVVNCAELNPDCPSLHYCQRVEGHHSKSLLQTQDSSMATVRMCNQWIFWGKKLNKNPLTHVIHAE